MEPTQDPSTSLEQTHAMSTSSTTPTSLQSINTPQPTTEPKSFNPSATSFTPTPSYYIDSFEQRLLARFPFALQHFAIGTPFWEFFNSEIKLAQGTYARDEWADMSALEKEGVVERQLGEAEKRLWRYFPTAPAEPRRNDQGDNYEAQCAEEVERRKRHWREKRRRKRARAKMEAEWNMSGDVLGFGFGTAQGGNRPGGLSLSLRRVDDTDGQEFPPEV